MSFRFNHSRREPARHRFWPTFAVLVLLAAGIAVAAHWLAGPPDPPSSRAIAILLPPTPPAVQPRDLASLSPAAGPTPASPAPPSPGAPSAAPSALPLHGPTDVAILPPAPAQPPAPAASHDPPPWLRFAAAAPLDARNRPRIAIVIDDLGLDRVRTERVISLPAAVTLSFLAYSGDLPRFADAARRNGHEMIVHVPMEPVNPKEDMGPNGLTTTQPRDEVLRRLDWDLGRFDGYVGINNHMGSRFTGDVEAMGWVMDDLKSRGLMFLDSRTIATSIGGKVAAADGVPFAERDVFLDDDQSETAIERRLQEAADIARRKGSAIAIGHPHDTTINALIGWIANLPQKGVVLVPLTDVVKARMGLS